MMLIKRYALLLLLFLVGCGPYSHQSFNNLNFKKDVLKEAEMDNIAIFYTILSTKQNNQRFDITFSLTSEHIPNCENLVAMVIYYDGFKQREPYENISLILDLESENGNKSRIDLKVYQLSVQQLKKLNKEAKVEGLKINNQRDFILTKDAYRKLLNARAIHYTLKTKYETLKGVFPPDSIVDIRTYSSALLANRCLKVQTIAESKEELKQGFTDFEVLKKGATKTELENHFKTQFKNTVKDPETGAFEETIILKVFGQPLGPMIIGFDEQDNLVYTRDAFNKAKITYLKDK